MASGRYILPKAIEKQRAILCSAVTIYSIIQALLFKHRSYANIYHLREVHFA